MASTLSGASGTDVILPEGVTTDDVKVSKEDGTTVIKIDSSKTSDLDVIAKGDTELKGKSLIDPTVTVDAPKGESANVVIETTVFKNGTIANEGKGSLKVNLNTGKVKNLTIDAGNKKRDDLVRIKDDVKLIKATMEMGKGNDTVRFGGKMDFKGKSTVDLGKGGKDAVILESTDGANGKLTITNVGKKDTITVGDETFTGKDIAKGAEVPGVKVELA